MKNKNVFFFFLGMYKASKNFFVQEIKEFFKCPNILNAFEHFDFIFIKIFSDNLEFSTAYIYDWCYSPCSSYTTETFRDIQKQDSFFACQSIEGIFLFFLPWKKCFPVCCLSKFLCFCFLWHEIYVFCQIFIANEFLFKNETRNQFSFCVHVLG